MKSISILCVLLLFFNCKGQDKKELKSSIATSDTIQKIQPYTYTHDKQIHYGIGISCFASFELYIDDILVAKEETAGTISSGVELNDWVLKNGTHNFRVRYLPQTGKEFVEPYLLTETRVTIEHWNYVENSVLRPHSGKEQYESIFFEVPVPTQKVPFWEFSGEFEVENLPFELTGWTESQDLSKMDQDELLKEVIIYYEYFRGLLNEGNIKQLLIEEKQKNMDVAIATYDDPNWYYSKESIDGFLKYINAMLPIENYKLELYGNGRLVKLVRIDEGIFKNWGVLIGESETEYFSTGGFLHKPKGSDSFKVIRK
ncbi:hypothetical protein [Cellulophaga sp. L1A9]|uniref:hypothetical protein n=1 Tax=Cellulophaga sp. L1A9 TaxID=2686362 RepID=UPI00131D745A|nr:hypothetical protein [Cellulophaga sp. L1A9]